MEISTSWRVFSIFEVCVHCRNKFMCVVCLSGLQLFFPQCQILFVSLGCFDWLLVRSKACQQRLDKGFVSLQKASELSRREKLPRIFISANSGARIGLAEEIKSLFRVEWEDADNPEKVQALAFWNLTTSTLNQPHWFFLCVCVCVRDSQT